MSYYQSQYDDLIEKYRRKQEEIRKAERKNKEVSLIMFLDEERDKVHKELRRVGSLMGKGPQDITLDIIESERDLSEYGLSEFKIMSTNNALEKITWVNIYDGGEKPKKLFAEYGKFREDELPENVRAFIPFCQHEFWHCQREIKMSYFQGS